MKAEDVKVGERYVVRLYGGQVATVLITAESKVGGWKAVDARTGAKHRIASADRILRRA